MMDLSSDGGCPIDHRVNKCEKWLNGEHCFGVIQCGTCGKISRYDIRFKVDVGGMSSKFFERVDGVWRQVGSIDDLVFDFEGDA